MADVSGFVVKVAAASASLSHDANSRTSPDFKLTIRVTYPYGLSYQYLAPSPNSTPRFHPTTTLLILPNTCLYFLGDESLLD
jgi:hypothetical protein